MRRFAFLAALLVACSPAANNAADTSIRQQGANDAAARAAIDASIARFAAALTKSDTAGMMSVYSDDAVIMMSGAKMTQGRAANAQMFAGMFAGISIPQAKFTTTDVLTSGDYAIETGTYAFTIQPKKGKAMADVGKYLTVWKKQADGSYKIIRDIANSDIPPK